MPLCSAVDLSQHADQHRPENPILLAVDQQLGEGGSRVRGGGAITGGTEAYVGANGSLDLSCSETECTFKFNLS